MRQNHYNLRLSERQMEIICLYARDYATRCLNRAKTEELQIRKNRFHLQAIEAQHLLEYILEAAARNTLINSLGG